MDKDIGRNKQYKTKKGKKEIKYLHSKGALPFGVIFDSKAIFRILLCFYIYVYVCHIFPLPVNYYAIKMLKIRSKKWDTRMS